MAKKLTQTFDPAKPPAHVHQSSIVVPEPESIMPYPVVKLMQALSPELDDSDSKFISDASQGDIVVTDGASSTVIDGQEGFKFAPVLVRKVWNEWIPRKQGGGFVASYNSREEMEVGFTAGNEIVISIDYLIATNELSNDKELDLLLLQFNSATKMARAREMAGSISKYKTMEGVTYHLTSMAQKNKAGQKFYNFMISPVGWTAKPILDQLKDLQVEAGQKFLPEPDDKVPPF